MFDALCRDRFGQISDILKKKYETTVSLDERIGILNHLGNISVILGNRNSGFVIDIHSFIPCSSG